MQCRVCGAENEAGSAFCFRCGSALAAPPATGATVSLGQGGGLEPPLPHDEPTSGVRVYDAAGQPQRTAPLPEAEPESTARVYDSPPPATGATEMGLPPSFQPPAPAYRVPPAPSASYTVPAGAQTLPQQSNAALWSMLLGVGSLLLFLVLLCTIFLPPLSVVLGIPAVIVGRNAQRAIRASNGTLSGEGMARAGVIMGWINIGLSVLALLGIIAFFALAIFGVSTSP